MRTQVRRTTKPTSAFKTARFAHSAGTRLMANPPLLQRERLEREPPAVSRTGGHREQTADGLMHVPDRRLQRQIEPEEEQEEELIQTKASGERTAQVGPAGEAAIGSLRGRGQPLSRSARTFFEPRLKHNFGDVRVHAGGGAAQAARRTGARAFTVGRDIVFDAGEYAPNTVAGRRLIAHELTHVVQQTGGRAVRQAHTPTDSEHPSEEEAERVADAVVAGQSPTIRARAQPGTLQRARGDRVVYGGGHSAPLTVVKRGKPIFTTWAVSGHPSAKEYEKNKGPIPSGRYALHPQRKRRDVTKWLGRAWGARAISSGYQEITDPHLYVCPRPGSHYCWTRPPKKGGGIVTRIQAAWGQKRIKIEGSKRVATPAGRRVTRSGFYIHGGLGTVTATSGCIKVFDDATFNYIRKLRGRVPLIVK